MSEDETKNEQFPSLQGDQAAEVEKRSADGAEGTERHKTFVVQGEGLDASDHPAHEANKLFVLDEAIQNGLHPTGEARFVGAKLQARTRRGVETWEVTYGVTTVPAVVHEDASETVTPTRVMEKSAKRAPARRKSES